MLEQTPGVIAKTYDQEMSAYQDIVNGRLFGVLLDYPIARRPRLDFDSIGQPFEGLVMRAVHRAESMDRCRAVAQRLDVLPLIVVVPGNIDMQSTAESYIQHLQTSTNRQDRLS